MSTSTTSFVRSESRIARIIDAAANDAQRFSQRLSEQIRELWAHEYAEPGYGPGVAVMGNWNEPRWLERDLSDANKAKATRLWARMQSALEKVGAQLEWEDEWSSCGDCGRIVRTQGDSYSWQPSFAIVNECELVCHECLESDPEPLLRGLEGDASRCLTIDSIDPADHGYRQINEEPLETGWHPGQTDSPEVILGIMHALGAKRVLFQLHENSQFYSRWNAWVHEDELEGVALEEIREAIG
jgi:hypothetical protein